MWLPAGVDEDGSTLGDAVKDAVQTIVALEKLIGTFVEEVSRFIRSAIGV